MCLCKCQNNEKLICFPTTEDHQRQNGSVKDKMVQFIKAREMFFFIIAWSKRGRVSDTERGGAEVDGNGVLHSPSAALSWRF